MSDEESLKRFIEARNIRELIKAAGFEFHLSDYYERKDGDVYSTAKFHDSVTNTARWHRLQLRAGSKGGAL